MGTVCSAGLFFLRDHRRTSPFSNLFKILLDFGTELLLFPNCFISECSGFFLYFIFAVFKAEINLDVILVRSSDRCCIPLNMKMNKYLHQFSFAVMLCSN